MTNFSHDICVVGGGAVGLFTAALLSKQGRDVALIAPLAKPDPRTTALMQPAIQALKNLNVFEKLEAAYPLKEMRIIDATNSLLKAPEVSFHASELGLDEFGFNIENNHLIEALTDSKIKRYFSPLNTIENTVLILDDVTKITAKLIIGADGKNSKVRECAGLKLKATPYDQVAFVTTLTHTKPHNDASTEFHTNDGPCTFVPLGDNRSSLVWVRRKDKTSIPLANELEKLTQLMFGRMTLSEQYGLFPLSLERPTNIIAERIALVGEAAHVLPPIGAQGLNLGLRDAAWLAETLETYEAGSKQHLELYADKRLNDIAMRAMAVNGLNRSLLTSLMPLHMMRSLGLQAMNSFAPLREMVMKKGIAAENLPKIMNQQ